MVTEQDGWGEVKACTQEWCSQHDPHATCRRMKRIWKENKIKTDTLWSSDWKKNIMRIPTETEWRWDTHRQLWMFPFHSPITDRRHAGNKKRRHANKRKTISSQLYMFTIKDNGATKKKNSGINREKTGTKACEVITYFSKKERRKANSVASLINGYWTSSQKGKIEFLCFNFTRFRLTLKIGAEQLFIASSQQRHRLTTVLYHGDLLSEKLD